MALFHPHDPVRAGRLARAAAALLVLGLVVTVPAVAAADPAAPAGSVVFTSPAGGATTFTTSAITLAGTAEAVSGAVIEVDVAVGPSGGPATDRTTLIPDSPGALFTWSWAPALTANGRYTVTAAALITPNGGGAGGQVDATGVFVVDVPPQPPSGLTSVVDVASRTVSLAWSPNPEPDLTGYLILRAGPGASASFAPVNIVAAGAHAYTDTEVSSEPPGVYRYEVVAIRAGGTGSRTEPSRPSAPTTVSVATPALGVTPNVSGPPTSVPGAPSPATARAKVPPAASAPSATTPPASAIQVHPATTAPSATSAAPQATSTPPATAAPSAPRQGAGRLVHRNTKNTAYEVLDAVLILSVLLLFAAVRRDRRRRVPPLDALEPDRLLDHLASGGSITVGEALARRTPREPPRAGPPPPAPPAPAQPAQPPPAPAQAEPAPPDGAVSVVAGPSLPHEEAVPPA